MDREIRIKKWQKKNNHRTHPLDLDDCTPPAIPGNADGVQPLEKLVGAFEKVRPELKDDLPCERFLRIIKDMEAIVKLMQRIGGYAELWFSEDTQNQAALSLLAKVAQLSADVSNRVLFFSLWWKELDDKSAQRQIKYSGDYRYWLEEMRHFKPHTLSEAEEKIINIKDVTGSNALITLYDSFTNRYTFKISVEGEEKEVTRGELMTYVRMPDAELRAAAYRELYRVFGQDGNILGQMYQTVVRDWRNENIGLRHYLAHLRPQPGQRHPGRSG
jgi:oligoendopeptidase F